MVTNGEFLEFVVAGGYEDKVYWSEEGWRWKQYRQAKHPVFWVCNQGNGTSCTEVKTRLQKDTRGVWLKSYFHRYSASINAYKSLETVLEKVK